MSRTKGKVGERECATLVRSLIPGIDAKRSYHQSRGGAEAPDVLMGDLPVWAEVKRHARPNIPAAIKQATEECGERPLWPVAFTRADRGEWLATMSLEDWCDLVREWRERTYSTETTAARGQTATIE